MPEQLPKVTRADVLRILERDFERAGREQVLRLLGEHGGEGAARVQLAVLKLSGGTVAGVRDQLAVARKDVRDVISSAEYPELQRCVGVDQLTHEEREAMHARDRRQYEAWLTRT